MRALTASEFCFWRVRVKACGVTDYDSDDLHFTHKMSLVSASPSTTYAGYVHIDTRCICWVSRREHCERVTQHDEAVFCDVDHTPFTRH